MKIVEELKKDIQNANAEKVDYLQKSVDPVYWFLLLAEYPEFAPDSDWWFDLRNRCDLPWCKLLAAQPQFDKYCHWESVSRLDLMLLAFKNPQIFKQKFPKGRPNNLYDFLTPLEKAHLLIETPEYAKQVNWEEINSEFSIGNWFSLLAYQPQFEEYFDWSKVEKQPNHYWDMLLKNNRNLPSIAIWKNFSQTSAKDF